MPVHQCPHCVHVTTASIVVRIPLELEKKSDFGTTINHK